MNIRYLPHQAPFQLDKVLPREQYADGLRPTVSVLVRNQQSKILLVCPKKAEEHANAFMFPQGKIKQLETPLEAALRILLRQCSYKEEMLLVSQTKAIKIFSIKVDDTMTKNHHVVFIRLSGNQVPVLNDENRKALFASGPNNLWSKVSDCRLPKRMMVVASVVRAVQGKLLLSDRWQLDRWQNLRLVAGI